MFRVIRRATNRPRTRPRHSSDESLCSSLTTIFSSIGIGVLIYILCFIVASATLPLLVIAFLVFRLLQFIRHDRKGNGNAALLEVYIRTWILIDLVILLYYIWFSAYLISHFVSKEVVFIGLPIKTWMHTCLIICGIYALNYVISMLCKLFIPLFPLDEKDSGVNVSEAVIETFDCLVFWLGEYEVMVRRVPSFKNHKILGLYTQNWISASLFFLIAYNVCTLCTHLVVWFLRRYSFKVLDSSTNYEGMMFPALHQFKESLKKLLFNRDTLLYYANGMKYSANFVFNALLLTLVWVFYLMPQLKAQAQAQAQTQARISSIVDLGTWTCVSLLICSFCWMIKTSVILSWEASSVYRRLHSKIFQGGKQLYFLGIIFRHNYLFEAKKEEVDLTVLRNEPISALIGNDNDAYNSLCESRKEVVKDDLLNHPNPTLYDIYQMCLHLLAAEKELAAKENHTSDFLDDLKRRGDCQCVHIHVDDR